jgi:hypothetical protein
VFSSGGRGVPWSEPPGMGLLRSIVDGGFDEEGGDVLGEAFSPPPEPPLHATRTATRAMTSDLVTDWEEQPPIALSLYLRALATIPGCPLCGKTVSRPPVRTR